MRWEKLKRRVKKSQKGCCVQCGEVWPLQIHHVVPISAGGTNERSNLIALCLWCHCAAHDRTPVLTRQQAAARIAAGQSIYH